MDSTYFSISSAMSSPFVQFSCCLLRLAHRLHEVGERCSSRPTRPMTNSLSSASSPWHARRMSCASSACPYAMPICACSRRMPPCSCGSSRAKAPVRRSGYQTCHGVARRPCTFLMGRRSRTCSRSGSWPVRRCGRASRSRGASSTRRSEPAAKSGRTRADEVRRVLAPGEQADAARGHERRRR